ncbi:MAG: exodeoxyribonuclease VII small subunit [Oscillospiraceae bacterium]|nr:exodeoxyribonuclease VII small subunit [Oscillospiraceae bacterium]
MAELKYEEAICRIEEIVKALEKGDAPLDLSLDLFKEATALVQKCSGMLENARQEVVRLRKGEDGSPIEEAFDRMGEIDD